MSKYHNKPERNPWITFLYILTVLALIGCLVCLLYYSRQRKEEYMQAVERAQAAEMQQQTEEKQSSI